MFLLFSNADMDNAIVFATYDGKGGARNEYVGSVDVIVFAKYDVIVGIEKERYYIDRIPIMHYEKDWFSG